MPASQRTRTPRAGGRRRLPATLIFVGAVLLIAGALARPGAGVSPAGTHSFASGGGGGGTATTTVTVNLTDVPSFDPSSLSASPGAAIAVHLVNEGSYAHTFSLSSVANFTINRSWSPSALDAFFHANGSWANVSLGPGGSAWANFTLAASASGTYEFVSLVPYQFQAGMLGFLTVAGSASGNGVVLQEQTSGGALAFVPAVLAANATTFPVTLDVAVSNLGSNAHTWTLLAQPDTNVTPGNWASYLQAHPPAANVSLPTTPGQVVWANFTVSQKGVYQFICEIPGHLGAGMQGYLYVGVPPPANVSAPGTAIIEPLLLLGGGALLGMGVVLALVASLIGRIPLPGYGPRH